MKAKKADLLGPTISSEHVSGLGAIYSRYEADFVKYANKHWASEGANWASANYYDRAKIYYAWGERTGDQTYIDRANALAVDYRDKYLVAGDYKTSSYWSQIGGVALHYLQTGDEASRTAVGKVADLFSCLYANYLSDTGNVKSGMDCRVQARTLEAILYAYEIDAPSVGIANGGIPGGNNWGNLLHSSLNSILASQSADGAYRFAYQGGTVMPYMVGLLNDAMITYYNNFDADPRILEAVKKSLNYLWDHTWDPVAHGFRYLEVAYNGESSNPAPDLNNIITSGFGWVYHMTGDTTYKTRGDLAFSGAVNAAWLDGSKQFNEEYTSSYKYLAWLAEGPIAVSGTPSKTHSPGAIGGGADYGAHNSAWHVQGTGDLNGDGTSDVLWRNTSTGEITSWFMSHGSWVAGNSYGTQSLYWQIQAVNDFDGNGTDDILWRNKISGEVSLWIMSDGKWVANRNYGTHSLDWQITSTADLNGDGSADILWRNKVTGEVSSWLIEKGALVDVQSYGRHGADWEVQGAGDFNGDGTSDLLWRNKSSGEVTSWTMSDGHWVRGASFGIHEKAWQVQGIGDFNGDGTSDILWRNTSSGEVTSWTMDNGHLVESHSYGTHDNLWQVQKTADLNGDGTDDILWQNSSTGHVTSWLMNGDWHVV